MNFNRLLTKNNMEILHYKLRQLGWQGFLGASLIILSIGGSVLFTMPKTQEVQQLTNEIDHLKASLSIRPKMEVADTGIDIVQKFYAFLPRQIEANNKINEILHAATTAGLVANNVEYLSQYVSPELLQTQIKLPVQGSYIQIRQFINHVLNKLPAVALNDISLKREDIATDLVDARLQFTLYLKRN